MNKNRKIIATTRNINNKNQIIFDINNQNNKKINIENNYKLRIKEKFKKLESQKNETFSEINSHINENLSLNKYYLFLYHGIRFQNHLEKLEQIFESGAILAGNYQKYYYLYDDNCNDGEYISLLAINSYHNLEYRTFIMPNISLVISSECNAIKTIYIPYEEWIEFKKMNPQNRYSYAHGEYQVKEKIPLDMIKAIGLPERYLILTNKEHLIDTYKNDILELMYKYNIDIPIVDTSNYNKPIFIPEKYQSNKKRILSLKN